MASLMPRAEALEMLRALLRDDPDPTTGYGGVFTALGLLPAVKAVADELAFVALNTEREILARLTDEGRVLVPEHRKEAFAHFERCVREAAAEYGELRAYRITVVATDGDIPEDGLDLTGEVLDGWYWDWHPDWAEWQLDEGEEDLQCDGQEEAP